ncbi:MAG: transposase, partial [Ginsengibacter sp.]
VYHCSKKRVYPLKDKTAIVRAINEGRTTKKEACISHDIDKKVLNQWIRNFRNQSDELSSSNEVTMIEIKDSLKEEAGKELAQAMLKIKALETMIDIAEEQFKINIRKKFRAKQ